MIETAAVETVVETAGAATSVIGKVAEATADCPWALIIGGVVGAAVVGYGGYRACKYFFGGKEEATEAPVAEAAPETAAAAA